MKNQNLSYCGVRKVSFSSKFIKKFPLFLFAIPLLSSCYSGNTYDVSNNPWTTKGYCKLNLYLYDEDDFNEKVSQLAIKTETEHTAYNHANNLYLTETPIVTDFNNYKYNSAINFSTSTIGTKEGVNNYDFAFQEVIDLSKYKCTDYENKTGWDDCLFNFNFSPKPKTRFALTLFDNKDMQSGSEALSFTFEVSLLIGYRNIDDSSMTYKEISLNNTGEKVSSLSVPASAIAYNVIWSLDPNSVSEWKTGIEDDPDPTKRRQMNRSYMTLIIKEKNNNNFIIG